MDVSSSFVGGSSTGKTRSLYEAVRNLVPDWWLVQPAEIQEIHDLATVPTTNTVLWLDDLHRYLGTDPPLTVTVVRKLVRAGTVVVGTLWPEEYFARRVLRRTEGADGLADDRKLLDFADVVRVPDALTPDERTRAERLKSEDSRIGAALSVSDVGFAQVLAAGPDLVHSWEQAPDAYARAIITAAADARRIGVHGPLSAPLLTEAMTGYLAPMYRVKSPEEWLASALRHAAVPLKGAVAALVPVAGPQPGTLGGYVIADYLAQHIRRTRRIECPPASLWHALTVHGDNPDDLRRLATAAMARMRYEYAERALMRLIDGNASTVIELATILAWQDRLDEAIALLDERLRTAPGDRFCESERLRIVDLRERALKFRQQTDQDPRALDWLAELLYDGGKADDLRSRADTGDVVAADELADLLAERGCLDELRERADAGNQFATERLADLLAGQGRVDELQRRADAGDRAARLQIGRLANNNGEGNGRQPGPVRRYMSLLGGTSQAGSETTTLPWLQAAADEEDEDAAIQLTAHLFDARDRDGLLAEVNAGTFQAVERYLALLTAEQSIEPASIAHLRAFGLNADGSTRLAGGVP